LNLLPASQFSIDELVEAYNKTRVDYLVPMPMTAQRLAEYIHDYDVSLDASAAAVDDGEIIGLCMLGLRGKHAWVTRLGVLPDLRKRHTGLRLVEHCLEQAEQNHAAEAYLEVIVGNTPAHNLFTRLGFQEIRKLLILRRPPSQPAESQDYFAALSRSATPIWLNHAQTVLLAEQRSGLPAWTNRTETFRNVDKLCALQIEHSYGTGWVSYEETAFQLRRVMITTGGEMAIAPAYSLLHHLHTQFPLLDTIAENIPADSTDLAAYYALGYVASFVRIEMMRSLRN
jgi:ribosomal protein S18 acetylase RimI-like enzyme